MYEYYDANVMCISIDLHKPISISHFSGITSNTTDVTMLNGMTLKSSLIFEQVLSKTLYATLKGTCDEKEVVIKFFFNSSDKNNEFEIMRFVQEETLLHDITPIPYIKIDNPKYSTYIIGDTEIDNVWKIIIYEYIPGIPILYLKNVDIRLMHSDIESLLSDLKSIGLIHADVHVGNIIRTPNGRFRLIDFGQTFSIDHRFPPIDYMFDEEFLPTFSNDIDRLSQICHTLQLYT